MEKAELYDLLKSGMIVSCQAEGDDPFNADPSYMALFARAAQMGGAAGIRTQGIAKLKAIKCAVGLPVIGLTKTLFEDGTVRITGSFKEVEDLIAAGSDMVAIDGTFRSREGLSGPDFIKEAKARYGCLILADIATLDEAIACEVAGADAVSTALNGYTPDTAASLSDAPNLALLSEASARLAIPVFAEGRYNTPQDAADAIRNGAFCVVTGTAITRPRVVTGWFVEKIKEASNYTK